MVVGGRGIRGLWIDLEDDPSPLRKRVGVLGLAGVAGGRMLCLLMRANLDLKAYKRILV